MKLNFLGNTVFILRRSLSISWQHSLLYIVYCALAKHWLNMKTLIPRGNISSFNVKATPNSIGRPYSLCKSVIYACSRVRSGLKCLYIWPLARGLNVEQKL